MNDKLNQDKKNIIISNSKILASNYVKYEFGMKVAEKLNIDEVFKIDCSGLTRYLLSLIDIDCPEGSYNQYNQSFEINELDGDTGDLVFKKQRGTNQVNHVGMLLNRDWLIEAEGWVGSVIIRPVNKFKLETSKSIYAGMRRLNIFK